MAWLKPQLKKSLRKIGSESRKRKNNYLIKSFCILSQQIRLGYDNIQFVGTTNGEQRFLRHLGKQKSLKTVFDVGANVGLWALEAKECLPEAKIHCFEPLHQNFAQLVENLGDDNNIVPNNFGLSSKDQTLQVNFSSKEQTTATTSDIISNVDNDAISSKFDNKQKCCFKNPLTYLQNNNINKIDLLKIDVEGMDFDVLNSFENLKNLVNIVQFEYTVFSRINRILIRDFFDLLVPQGFSLYKIFPFGLEFMKYNFALEGRADGNYIAVNQHSPIDVTEYFQ